MHKVIKFYHFVRWCTEGKWPVLFIFVFFAWCFGSLTFLDGVAWLKGLGFGVLALAAVELWLVFLPFAQKKYKEFERERRDFLNKFK